MSDFCTQGCYWPDCEHRSEQGALPAPPAGTRWIERAGLQVAKRDPVTAGFDEAVDEFFAELLLMTGRPWSPL